MVEQQRPCEPSCSTVPGSPTNYIVRTAGLCHMDTEWREVTSVKSKDEQEHQQEKRQNPESENRQPSPPALQQPHADSDSQGEAPLSEAALELLRQQSVLLQPDFWETLADSETEESTNQPQTPPPAVPEPPDLEAQLFALPMEIPLETPALVDDLLSVPPEPRETKERRHSEATEQRPRHRHSQFQDSNDSPEQFHMRGQMTLPALGSAEERPHEPERPPFQPKRRLDPSRLRRTSLALPQEGLWDPAAMDASANDRTPQEHSLRSASSWDRNRRLTVEGRKPQKDGQPLPLQDPEAAPRRQQKLQLSSKVPSSKVPKRPRRDSECRSAPQPEDRRPKSVERPVPTRRSSTAFRERPPRDKEQRFSTIKSAKKMERSDAPRERSGFAACRNDSMALETPKEKRNITNRSMNMDSGRRSKDPWDWRLS